MNRMIRGMAGLMVALGVSACGEDPSVDFGGDAPTKIQASPTSMFVAQDVPEPLLVRLVDDRNRSTATSFDISDVSAGLTVVLDDEYRPDYIGSEQLEFNPIQHQHRFFVTGLSPVEGSFTVSSGGFSQVITVRVIPSAIPISFGAVTDHMVDISSEQFIFDMATTFTFGTGVIASPLAVSADGHTATILAPPSLEEEVPTITGARASYMPTVALAATPGSTGLTTPAAAMGQPDYPSTFNITLPNTTFTFTDIGNLTGPDIVNDGGPMLWYHFTVTEDRHIDLTLSWAGGNDLDWFLFDSEGNEVMHAFAGGAGPEHNSADIAAGEYDFGIVNFNSNTAPTFMRVVITP